MVDLLKEEHKSEFKKIKNTKNSFQKPQDNSQKENKESAKKRNDQETMHRKRQNLSRYRDLEGLSVGKMEFGFWFIKNKKTFVNIFYGVLIIIGAVTWPIFFYTFGHYVLVGMKQDRQLADDLVAVSPVRHSLILSKMPKPLIYDVPDVLIQKDISAQVVLDVENQNEKHWAIVDYSYFANNQEILQTKDFILPNERKYFLDVIDKDLLNRNNVDIKINNVAWSRHDKGEPSDYKLFYDDHINFAVTDLEFVPSKKTVLTEKLPINSLSFNIKNETPFNYWSLPLNMILYSKGSAVLGFSKYTIENFMSGDDKDIVLSIPGTYKTVSRVEVFPNLNIMLEDIYIDFTGGGDGN